MPEYMLLLIIRRFGAVAVKAAFSGPGAHMEHPPDVMRPSKGISIGSRQELMHDVLANSQVLSG